MPLIVLYNKYAITDIKNIIIKEIYLSHHESFALQYN